MQERLTAMEHEFAIVTREVTAKIDQHTIMLRDLNSAMSEQGQELHELKMRTGTIEIRLGTIDSRLNRMGDQLTSLREDVTSLKGDVTSLKGDVSSLKDEMHQKLDQIIALLFSSR